MEDGRIQGGSKPLPTRSLPWPSLTASKSSRAASSSCATISSHRGRKEEKDAPARGTREKSQRRKNKKKNRPATDMAPFSPPSYLYLIAGISTTANTIWRHNIRSSAPLHPPIPSPTSTSESVQSAAAESIPRRSHAVTVWLTVVGHDDGWRISFKSCSKILSRSRSVFSRAATARRGAERIISSGKSKERTEGRGCTRGVNKREKVSPKNPRKPEPTTYCHPTPPVAPPPTPSSFFAAAAGHLPSFRFPSYG